jgi:predicted transglutaminase-like cysteine proteinase
MNVGLRISLFLLILSQVALGQTPAEFRKFAEESVYDVWYGIYAADQKFGYYHLSAFVSDDGEHYVVNEEMLAVSTFAGERSEDRSNLVVHYSLEDGKIVYSRAEDTGGGERLLITVEPEGDRLKLTSNTGDRTQARVVDIPKTSLGEEMRFVTWMRNAKPGDTFQSVSLDWTKEPVDSPQAFTFKSKETGAVSGIVTELYTLQEKSFDLVEDGQFDHGGVPVWQKVGGLFEIRREPKEIAETMDEAPVEILVKTTVKSDIKLGEPPLHELVLDASGLGDYKFPEASYQKVRYLPDGKARIVIRPPEGKPEPNVLESKEQYLKSTPSLQVDSTEITQLVRSLGLEGMSEREKVEKLTNWVYNHLEKVSNVNASTSISVLNNEAGDCTEHALLLTTMLRAAGIPARQLSGLVYTNDQLQVFGYHAWVEVHVDGGWMAVDPSFDQVPADAGHILQSREDSLAELQIMGKLKLKVVRLRSKNKNYVLSPGTDHKLGNMLFLAFLGTVVVGASRPPAFE